jgi:hypothetical protein
MEDIKPDLGEPVHQTEESKAGHQWISVAAYYKAENRGFAPALNELARLNTVFEIYIDLNEAFGNAT